MADVWRAGKRLLINGSWVEPGTVIANADTTYPMLLAMLSANEIVHTQTSVTETNATRQFIPTTVELNWTQILPGPSKGPSPTILQLSEVPPEDQATATLAGHGTVTAAGAEV